MNSVLARHATPESHARRVFGRIGANPVTWLRYQVERTVDVSPETLAHIRGQFKKLTLKHGHLSSLPDEIAEREYIRIAYRLNFMRTQSKLLSMKVTDKGYHTVSKTLGIWAAATLKFRGSKGEGQNGQPKKKSVPTPRRSQAESREHEHHGGESGDGEEA